MSVIENKWRKPVTVTPNNFIYKSLSNWACNIAVGCNHACRFCYVPSASTIKLAPTLKEFGVSDPDAEWGDYVLVRPWDEKAFKSSLRSAVNTPAAELKPDGNRAIMFCSTTDAYQAIKDKTIADLRRTVVRNALRVIRDESDLNVRILTRSPLAREDFDLFKSFGNRLLLGSSIPTLNNKLAKVYEPMAPAPTQRLKLLRDAADAGIPVYVAMAPTYPECDESDIAASLVAFMDLKPWTIFHEPINIRAENVERIRKQAEEIGVKLNTEVFASRDQWEAYALNQLMEVERIGSKIGIEHAIHLWPDKALGGMATRNKDANLKAWLESHWTKISAWPH